MNIIAALQEKKKKNQLPSGFKLAMNTEAPKDALLVPTIATAIPFGMKVNLGQYPDQLFLLRSK